MVATLNRRKWTSNGGIRYGANCTAEMRILYITTRQRAWAWLTETLATENIVQVKLEEAVGKASGLARLRDEVFDAVLISHLPGELDALELVEGDLGRRGRGADSDPGPSKRTRDGRRLLRGGGRRHPLHPHHDHAQPDLAPCPRDPAPRTALRKSSP